MKILLISDIHGNYPALQAVGEQNSVCDCDLVLNSGDTTVYAPFPNETIDWLRKRKAITIRGNTDDKVIKLLQGKQFKKPARPEKRIMYTSTADQLSKKSVRYLLALKKKKTIRLGKQTIGLFHGSPADHDEFLFANSPVERFRELAGTTSCSIVITGHSHSPYHREIEGVHFINPGSVGRMFDGRPEASYALLQLTDTTIRVEHYRCGYDVEAVIRELQRQGLPEIYEVMFRSASKLN